MPETACEKLDRLAIQINQRLRAELPVTMARIEQAKEALEHAQQDVETARERATSPEFLRRVLATQTRDMLTTALKQLFRSAHFALLLASGISWQTGHYIWALLFYVAFVSTEYERRVDGQRDTEARMAKSTERTAVRTDELLRPVVEEIEQLTLLLSVITRDHETRIERIEVGEANSARP